MEPRSDNDRILGFVEDGRDTHVAPYAVGLRVLHDRTGPSMYRLNTGVDQLLRESRLAAEAFDRLVAETIEHIRATEPGTPMYVTNRVEDTPRRRVFYKIYTDRSALEAHEETVHVRNFLTRARSLRLVITSRVRDTHQGRTRPAGFQSRPEVVTCRESALPQPGTITVVSLRLLYQIFSQLLSWPALLGRTTSSKDIELRVLRRAGHRAGPAWPFAQSPAQGARSKPAMAAIWRRRRSARSRCRKPAARYHGAISPSWSSTRSTSHHSVGRGVGMLPRPRRRG
jgi:quinol monooxygenase YgiN